jgi:aspartyl-tRNA(Asn)/glutamyl-tRNA(Gln) amidotransferase subunit A
MPADRLTHALGVRRVPFRHFAIENMSDDSAFCSLSELSRRLHSGATSSEEIVAGCLTRIDALDGKLHAFIEVYRDDAMALARAADADRKAGRVRGPLHGLPIALKDLLHIEGRQTTAGSKSWLGRKSDHTATAVERLLAAGMIPLGKTHMVEFAFGGWGRNQPMGAPWNPWDMATHRVAGGSSSGSAVAVAGGLAPAAIGSDTGGSVRIPASLCGLTGLKTTYGLVSLYGAVPLSTTLDSIGPLAHTVEDTALLTAAMAGHDARDPATAGTPSFDVAAALAGTADVRGLRITALPPEQFTADVISDVRHAHAAMIALLRDLGATVDETPVPIDFEDLMVRNGRLIAIEAYAFHRGYVEDESLPLDPWVRKRLLGGKGISAADYLDDLACRRRAGAQFAAWMRDRDALLTPTLPVAAIPVADVDETLTPLATYTRVANYLGVCALSLPGGFTAENLPVGVQFIGAPFAEVTLVRIGRAVQAVTDWHRRHPAV